MNGKRKRRLAASNNSRRQARQIATSGRMTEVLSVVSDRGRSSRAVDMGYAFPGSVGCRWKLARSGRFGIAREAARTDSGDPRKNTRDAASRCFIALPGHSGLHRPASQCTFAPVDSGEVSPIALMLIAA
jgi:hypothetical protein